MGACFSLSTSVASGDDHIHPSPTAAVISISGDLHHYALPITARQVLESEPSQSFVCNSDALVYEDFIPNLNPNEELLSDNLYFILPNPKLQHRITGADVAALAVKASRALQEEELMKKRWRNNKCTQISPIRAVHNDNIASVDTTCASARSGSVRKGKKMHSNRLNTDRVVKLSTIYEGHEP